MTRTALPYAAPDLSALARLLERALADHHITHGRLPGHVEMMNLLARGAGKRNLQELQADAARQASTTLPSAAPATTVADAWFDAPTLLDAATPSGQEPPAPPLTERAARTLKCFDSSGRLLRWPPKLSQQRLAMWVLWTRFDGRRVYTEAEVNRVLKAWHVYGDHATLRRELINHALMTRKSDCSEYRKLPLEPDAEIRALLQALRSDARKRPARRSNRPPRVLPKAVAGTPGD